MTKKTAGKYAQTEVNQGGDYTADEEEFIRAMDRYKRRTGRKFPTFTEVLDVLKSLGYRKVEENRDAT